MEGDDVERIRDKTNTLAQASMKLGEAMYKATQGGPEGGAQPGRSVPVRDRVDRPTAHG